MNFDTLVVDCEGALYYILKEEPEFLNGFKTIIIENDFIDITHKEFVDEEFKRYDFRNVYSIPGGFGPCYNFFYQALGQKNENRNFYNTENPACSSLYQPNEKFLERYQHLELMKLKNITQIDTCSSSIL